MMALRSADMILTGVTVTLTVTAHLMSPPLLTTFTYTAAGVTEIQMTAVLTGGGVDNAPAIPVAINHQQQQSLAGHHIPFLHRQFQHLL